MPPIPWWNQRASAGQAVCTTKRKSQHSRAFLSASFRPEKWGSEGKQVFLLNSRLKPRPFVEQNAPHFNHLFSSLNRAAYRVRGCVTIIRESNSIFIHSGRKYGTNEGADHGHQDDKSRRQGSRISAR
jgi:hypothetical protein